jgi:hypothetical protein
MILLLPLKLKFSHVFVYRTFASPKLQKTLQNAIRPPKPILYKNRLLQESILSPYCSVPDIIMSKLKLETPVMLEETDKVRVA